MYTNEPILSTSNQTKELQSFLEYLRTWLQDLPAMTPEQVFPDPEKAAILSVDVTQGFCKSGALASPRVNAIVEPIVLLFERGWARGVRNILLSQDTHEPDAVEFSAWPPHCVRGTDEPETVAEIKRLPFYDRMITFPKNSINSGAATGLNAWIEDHPQVDTYVVVGDCTDLCVYQLAMQLRTEANARQLQRRVIVPANCVDTYDRSVEDARQFGGFPHPGDLMHDVFLYHMALNGVEVASRIG